MVQAHLHVVAVLELVHVRRGQSRPQRCCGAHELAHGAGLQITEPLLIAYVNTGWRVLTCLTTRHGRSRKKKRWHSQNCSQK